MTDYIFNEKKYIEAFVDSGYVDNNAPNKTIRLLARYCHFVLGYNKNDAYKYITSYMKTYALDFHEQLSMASIKTYINTAYKKGAWKNIECVPITEGELKKIASLNDEKKEKLAFVLLADVKYAAQISAQQRHISYMSISELFQLSRVPCPYKERAAYTSFLFEDREGGAFAVREFRNKDVRWNITYASYDEEDPVALNLTESNYKELAFTYLNWKNGGYKECKICGRLFKTKANMRYCKKCTPKHEKIENKIIICVDCGKEVEISSKDNKTCRCEECYQKHRSLRKIETQRIRRQDMRSEQI